MSGLSIKAEELEINTDHPFSDDALSRKEIATALTNLVKDEENPLVVGLHGSWGTGKTYLLKRWHQDLKNNEFQAIYFSAWEDDFCDDPLVAIVGQLWEELKGSDFKEIVKSAKESTYGLVGKFTNNVVKLKSGGCLDFKGDDFRSAGEKLVNQYSKSLKEQDALHSRLKELGKNVRDESKRPLIFIIDELDRCRPTFAISLLERIKHLFSIPNIVFVLGIDRVQLEISIKSVYGDNFDTDNYLRRFIDINFKLPEPDRAAFIKSRLDAYKIYNLYEHRDSIANKKGQPLGYDFFKDFFSSLAIQSKLTLREIEDCIRLFILVARNTDNSSIIPPDLLAFLVILRIKDRHTYNRYMHGGHIEGDLIKFIYNSSPDNTQIGNNISFLAIRLSITVYDHKGALVYLNQQMDNIGAKRNFKFNFEVIGSIGTDRNLLYGITEKILEDIEIHNYSPKDSKEHIHKIIELLNFPDANQP